MFLRKTFVSLTSAKNLKVKVICKGVQFYDKKFGSFTIILVSDKNIFQESQIHVQSSQISETSLDLPAIALGLTLQRPKIYFSPGGYSVEKTVQGLGTYMGSKISLLVYQ